MAPLLGVEQQHGQNWCARWDPCYNAPVTFWSGLLCMLIPAPRPAAKKPEGKCHMSIYDRRIALLMLGVAFWYLSMFE